MRNYANYSATDMTETQTHIQLLENSGFSLETLAEKTLDLSEYHRLQR
jgi:hypothetical protein